MTFFHSVRYACRGLWYALSRERNFRIQAAVGLLAVLVGAFFGLSGVEWLFLFFAMALVLCMELCNSAVEKLLDVVKPRLHDQVAAAKDVMAGAVLLSALLASVTGLVIFGPRFIEFVRAAWYTTMTL